MSNIVAAQTLQITTEVGNSTNIATSFTDTATFSKNSTTVAPIIADQLATTGPSFAIRTQGNEYLTARVVNLGVIFAGLIGTIPLGVSWTGFLRSSFTSGFTLDSSDFFTFYGAGGLSFRGGTVTQGFNLVTSTQGAFIQTPTIRTLFTNNAGIIEIPDPVAATVRLATLTLAETLTNKTLTTPTIADFTNANHNHSNAAGGGTIAHTALTSIGTNTHAQIDTHIASKARHSWVIGLWNARNIATTLTDQNTTFGGLTPGQFIFEVAGEVLGWFTELDQVVTAGTLTLTLFKNGASTGNTIVYTSASAVRQTRTLGTPISMAAGDRLDVKWTTSVGFTPSGAIDFNACIRGIYNE